MAKSLRSKSKLQAKSVKRKGEFAKYVDERSKRIADRLAKETAKQEAEKKKNKQEDGQETMDLDKAAEDGEEKTHNKKVSTSGWRDSNSQRYKQRQLKNKSKKKTLKF
ncbi:hypothetical protein CANMA_001412 [Candida margitis]|uniref:uncharacterized protein n=1 Tax=Candida margitis TaxID=1775924 RepID=UPI002227B628|nr:uncharacterized protein CANMA_001412 [Candida margitis]KAI5969562.1 hypothetical protein CANMA_001412 [Candida margitis]